MKGILLFDKQLRKFERVLAISAGIIVLILTALTTAEVFVRTFFNSSIPGLYELTTQLFIGIVFLAVPYVQSLKGHINVDVFTTKLSPTTQRMMDGFGVLLGLFIVVIIAWQTGIEAWKSFSTKEYTMGLVHIQLWPAKMALTVSLILLSIRLVIDAIILFFHKENEDTPTENMSSL